MPRLPSLTARELVQFLVSIGYEEVRQAGSHLRLRHPVSRISITVPVHTGVDLGRGLARTILAQAGSSVEAFLAWRGR